MLQTFIFLSVKSHIKHLKIIHIITINNQNEESV
jgi:hypothetical protein